jgi:energy-coupling factor transporter ATP-binding protein EcfA2
MSDWDEIGDRIWHALARLEVDPAQDEADREFTIALVGDAGCGKTTLALTLARAQPAEGMPLAAQERIGEYRLPLSVDDVADLDAATLLVLLLDATKGDYAQEVAAADYLSYLGKPMLVCYNKMDLLPVEAKLIRGQARWHGVEIMPLSATQPATVEELLVPAVLDALPECALALARHLSLFRAPVVDKLVERTALVNATYASASGLAEPVPLLRMPLSDADVAVLSENQAMMAYRVGLACGLPFDWHCSLRPSSPPRQAGPLWRQLARQVRGVVPMWGLGSKVRLAYGGTLLMGRAVAAWCNSGQELSPDGMRAICRDAAAQSRAVGVELVAKARDALPAAQEKRGQSRRFRIRLPGLRPRRRQLKLLCPSCGRANPPDATYCAYCGASLEGDGGLNKTSARPERDELHSAADLHLEGKSPGQISEPKTRTDLKNE